MSLFGNWRGLVIIGLAVATGLAVFVFSRPKLNVTSTSDQASIRQRYAALYQAAWRQDEGRGTMVMTATLLTPSIIQALGQDTGRSTTEEQIWSVGNSIDAQHLAIIITVDSVDGAVPDDAIQRSLTLAADGGPAMSVVNWRPIIAPSRIVNTQASASSQVGIAVFGAAGDIDWSKLGPLRLTVSGIGDQPTRVFTWAEPRLLLQV